MLTDRHAPIARYHDPMQFLFFVQRVMPLATISDRSMLALVEGKCASWVEPSSADGVREKADRPAFRVRGVLAAFIGA
jgi:hypothetical protein